MRLVAALAQTIWKMFAADLGLTLVALASVAVTGAAERLRVVPPAALPFALAAAILLALALGVRNGVRP